MADFNDDIKIEKEDKTLRFKVNINNKKFDDLNNRLDTVDNRLDTVDNRLDTVDNRLDTVLDLIYPIGSVYTTLDPNFDPNKIFNGTVWKKLDDIRYLRTDNRDIHVNSAYFDYELAINKAWQFHPRNLMDVLETTTVKETFAKLREYTSKADFSLFRLGDYIDLPSFNDGESNYTFNPNTENLRIQIVAFDHYYNIGATQMKTHHCVMQWKNVLRKRQLHSSNTQGGYRGTTLYNYLNTTFRDKLVEYIGLTPHPIDRLLDNRNSWAWGGKLDEYVFIPTEPEVFNSIGWAINGHGTGTSMQFPLYRMWPDARLKFLDGQRWWWWLASPSYGASTLFCCVDHDGVSSYGAVASYGDGGVSPCFCV